MELKFLLGLTRPCGLILSQLTHITDHIKLVKKDEKTKTDTKDLSSA